MISRRSVTPLVLVVLAAGTAAYAYCVDRKDISDEDRQERRGEVFPSFHREDVTRIAITRGDRSMVLERGQDAGSGEWTLVAPPLGVADASAVDVLLRELEGARRLRTVASRDARGFDAPRAEGTLSLGAIRYAFALGAEAPVPEGSAYLRVDREGTFVVAASVARELLKGPDAYRDRRLCPASVGDVEKVAVEGPDGSGYAVERHGGDFWLAAPPVRASRGAVERLLEGLDGARLTTFLDDAVAERGAAASTHVTIERGAPAPSTVELLVGGMCPTAAGSTIVVRTSPGRVAGCAPLDVPGSVGSLKDDSVLWAHADEIEEVRLERLEGGAVPLDVARRGSGWHERTPEDHDLTPDEATRVTDLLAELTGAHGAVVADADGGPGFITHTRITVVRTGGEWTERVEVGVRDADGSSLLRRAEDAAVLRLPPDVSTRLAGILRAM